MAWRKWEWGFGLPIASGKEKNSYEEQGSRTPPQVKRYDHVFLSLYEHEIIIDLLVDTALKTAKRSIAITMKHWWVSIYRCPYSHLSCPVASHWVCLFLADVNHRMFEGPEGEITGSEPVCDYIHSSVFNFLPSSDVSVFFITGEWLVKSLTVWYTWNCWCLAVRYIVVCSKPKKRKIR